MKTENFDKDSYDFKFGIKVFILYIIGLIFFAILLIVKTSEDKSTHKDLSCYTKDMLIQQQLE